MVPIAPGKLLVPRVAKSCEEADEAVKESKETIAPDSATLAKGESNKPMASRLGDEKQITTH